MGNGSYKELQACQQHLNGHGGVGLGVDSVQNIACGVITQSSDYSGHTDRNAVSADVM